MSAGDPSRLDRELPTADLPHTDVDLFRFGTLDGDEPRLLRYLFWPSVFVLFALAHFPLDRLDVLVRGVLGALPHAMFPATWSATNGGIPDWHKIGPLLISPLLGGLFCIGLLALLLPLGLSIRRSGFCRDLATFVRRHLGTVCGTFAALCVLTVPFRPPYALSGLGFFAAKMSAAPFDRTATDFPWTYRRLLMPAVAFILQLRGALFWCFSLVCTIVLLALVMYCLDQRSGYVSGLPEDRGRRATSSWNRALVLVSLCTTSFLMSNFIWPGYPEQLGYILILMAACTPMTRLARLVVVALALVAHEALAFALVPVVAICYPRAERRHAFAIIALYGLVWYLGARLTGTSIAEILTTHQILRSPDHPSVLGMIREHPGRFLVGLALGHKLAWVALGFAFVSLWRRGRRADAGTVVALTLVPLLALLVAWDTSRMTGLGFLGIVFSLALVLRSPARHRRTLAIVALVNLLIPSYNVMLVEPVGYPFLGAYQAIHATLLWLAP